MSVLFSGNFSSFVHSLATSSVRTSSNMARYRSLSPLLLLLLGVAMVMASRSDDEFNPPSYCMDMCSRGLGGNLCKCSSTLFAGKRSRTPLFPPFYEAISGSPRRSGRGTVAHRRLASQLRLHDTRQQAAWRWIESFLRHADTSSTSNNFRRPQINV